MTTIILVILDIHNMNASSKNEELNTLEYWKLPEKHENAICNCISYNFYIILLGPCSGTNSARIR